MWKVFLLTLLFCLAHTPASSQSLTDFETLDLGAESVWDGSAATLGTFDRDVKTGGVTFNNSHTRSDWGYGITESWSGFSYSKVTDNTTRGYGNQYSAIAGSGAGLSNNYGVMYIGMGLDKIYFDSLQIVPCINLCNDTYTYFSMKEGDAFAKKFGGADGNDPDYLLLSIIGFNNENPTDTIDFYLADYRFDNNEFDFIMDEWTNLDLIELGHINSLKFELSSSDIGDWGMNTPAYFCIDNLGAVDFESLSFTSGDFWNGSGTALGTYNTTFTDGYANFNNSYTLSDWGYGLTGSSSAWAYSSLTDNKTAGYTNSFSAIAGQGANGSQTYALCYASLGKESVTLQEPLFPGSIYITNGTYPYFSMKDGDAFAKKFGGESGDDPDFFLLQIFGYLDGQVTDTIDCYLADFRFGDNSLDYLINDWTLVDLSSLGLVDQLSFSLTSSDNGDWGMNTPAYFFIDDLFFSQSSGISSNENITSLSLYPNPAQETVTISTTEEIEQISIFSIHGRLMKSVRFEDRRMETQINISEFAQAHYLARIQTRSGTQTIRFVKN